MAIKKTGKYTIPVIQNEIIKTIALKVAETISENLQGTSFYTIMADETTDYSNKEQFAVCFRWIDNRFEVYEDFVGLQAIKSTDTKTLSRTEGCASEIAPFSKQNERTVL